MLVRDSALCRTSINPVFVMITGAAFGLGMACCSPARTRLRRAVTTLGHALTHGAVTFARRVNDKTVRLTEPSAELAKRIRLATRAGIREARRHLVVVREPSRERLAGVEGLAECL